MKKLFTVLALVFALGLFSSCEEEEISPQLTDKGGNKNVEDDPGQWD